MQEKRLMISSRYITKIFEANLIKFIY